MAKDRDRDSDTSITSQSKRLSQGQLDSDFQVSEQLLQQELQLQHQQQQQPATPHRTKPQKHVVGGTGRFHARVPSSKALHKHNAASTSKLKTRQPSPSPDRGTSVAGHRRAVSDVRLSTESSATNLKKDPSQSSLKRNRSHADVGKKKGSVGQLKKSSSTPGVNKLKSAKTQVHFDLGTDGQEDEWVDASASASPYLSRRGSTTSSASAKAQGAVDKAASPSPPASIDGAPASTVAGQEGGPDRETVLHKEYLTSRLLRRIPSHGAPPKMSAETVSVGPRVAQRQQSPDSRLSRESTSTLSGTPNTQPQPLMGSSGRDDVTSRFITNNSQGSGGGASFYTSGGSRPSTGRAEDGARRSRSLNHLARANDTETSPTTHAELEADERGPLSPADEEAPHGVAGSALASSARSRRPGNAPPPAEKSRTQQKLNLQRASSTMEPNHHHHGMAGLSAAVVNAAGPLVGGAGYDDRDPRVGKLLERTGLEYLIVRRYQNPVARSLNRLARLPGVDKGLRIPTAGGPNLSNGVHSKRPSTLTGGGQFGLSQSYRDVQNRPSTSGTQSNHRPVTPRRGYSSLRANGAGSSLDPEDDQGRMHERLSGSSLVNGEDDDSTLAQLRALWEKNLDLSASQD